MKKLFSVLLCGVFTLGLTAQDIISVSGKIIEKNSGIPVSFANVFLTNSITGTVSNEDGNFILKMLAGDLKALIIISHIGYSTLQLSVEQVNLMKGEIQMEPSPKVLDEITIKPIDPVAVVRKAVAAIQKNYSQNPLGMTGFYREYTKEDGKTVQLSEAQLGVYYSPYDGKKGDAEIKILKCRKGVNLDSSRFFKNGNNLNNIGKPTQIDPLSPN